MMCLSMLIFYYNCLKTTHIATATIATENTDSIMLFLDFSVVCSRIWKDLHDCAFLVVN